MSGDPLALLVRNNEGAEGRAEVRAVGTVHMEVIIQPLIFCILDFIWQDCSPER